MSSWTRNAKAKEMKKLIYKFDIKTAESGLSFNGL